VRMVLVWLVLGIMLLAVELRHLALYALFGAAGAFGAAAVAAVWPDLVVLQLIAAAGVATAGILIARPMMSEVLARRGEGRPARGVHGSLVGEEVVTLDRVGDAHHVGHVRLAGERWLAVNGLEGTIAEGTRVLVTGVRGTTLIVCPVDGWSHNSDELMSGSDQPSEGPSDEENRGEQP
jgi:membrane protein implicated in regulation of membrane protease activity